VRALSVVTSVAVLLACLWSFAPAAASGTVSFWTQNATNPAMLAVLESFTRETGIDVDLRAISYNLDELLVAFAAESPPDIFTHGGAALGAIASLDVLLPLDLYFERWDFTKDILPAVLEYGRYEGALVTVPIHGVSVRDLVFRKDLIEEAGLDSRRPFPRWDDLARDGQKLVRIGPNGVMQRSALNIGVGDQQFSMFYHQSGGSLSRDGGPHLDVDPADQALTFYHSLIHQLRLWDINFSGDLTVGTTAMSWAAPSLFYRGLDDGLLGVSTFPYSDKPATFGAVDWMAVTKGAKNLEGALALLEYTLRPEQKQILTQEFGGIPIYRHALEWDWLQEHQEVIAHFMSAFEYAVPNPSHRFWFDQRAVLRAMVDKVIRSGEPPRNAVLQAREQIEALWHQ